MKVFWYVCSALVSIALLVASFMGLVPTTPIEVGGFISGGLCVWLVVKDNIWNWPIGIINAVFFAVLFYTSALYADMALQGVYIILGFLGWYWWLYGGEQHKSLTVRRASMTELVLVNIGVLLFTWWEYYYLVSINDSAPFLDAFTTAISLGAQYLLTRKMIQNWYLWIFADVIYIGLYASRGLYLTSILYFVFLMMCIQGVREWRRIESCTVTA